MNASHASDELYRALNKQTQPQWFADLEEETFSEATEKENQWLRNHHKNFMLSVPVPYLLALILLPFGSFPLVVAAIAGIALFTTVRAFYLAATFAARGPLLTKFYTYGTLHLSGLGLLTFYCLSSMIANYLNTI